MNKRLVLGTAGHVDHGKTRLVLALSGIDTDRLKEEKARGITIELGFAHLDLPSGVRLGIVDVPGHERFVRAMVAGAGGIDMVALVIAADEGVMPQTREHLDVCRLLGVRHGLVVLTKIDLASDPELLLLVHEDVAALTAGTFLEGAPILEFSAETGQGKAELLAALDSLAAAVEQRPVEGLFRLPIDRVFTLRGLGTVVTGTSIEGELGLGAEAELLPSGQRARVRSIQVHGEPAEVARAGQRTAINLQGVEKHEVARGEVLTAADTLHPTRMFDAEVTLLAGAPRLGQRSRVRVHAGTAEALGRVIGLERTQLAPGARALAQVRLDQPLVLLPQDRFVLRSYSPLYTIGGGIVIHPRPAKHGAGKPELLADLGILAAGSTAERVEVHVRGTGFAGLPQPELSALVRAPRRELNRAVEGLLAQGVIVKIEREESRLLHRRFLEMIESAIGRLVDQHHLEHPTEPGMPAGELRSRIDYPLAGRALDRALERMAARNELVAEQERVRRPGHRVVLAGRLEQSVQQTAELLSRAGLTPPTPAEIAQQLGDAEYAAEALKLLAARGAIVRVAESLYFDAAALERLRVRLVEQLERNGEIDAQGYKELTGASRKFSIPLAEYFDRIKVTLRRGDKRVLRRSG